ncbi:MAG: cell division protein ZapA [Gemmatimonadota bacterium]
MSSEKHAVQVKIGGQLLTVSSEHPPEYTEQVAAHFDAAFQNIRSSMPTVDAHRAAILAGLAVTDELFQARQSDVATADRIQSITEQLARLLPPASRGGKA